MVCLLRRQESITQNGGFPPKTCGNDTNQVEFFFKKHSLIHFNALLGIYCVHDPPSKNRAAALTFAGCVLAMLGGIVLGNLFHHKKILRFLFSLRFLVFFVVPELFNMVLIFTERIKNRFFCVLKCTKKSVWNIRKSKIRPFRRLWCRSQTKGDTRSAS